MFNLLGMMFERNSAHHRMNQYIKMEYRREYNSLKQSGMSDKEAFNAISKKLL